MCLLFVLAFRMNLLMSECPEFWGKKCGSIQEIETTISFIQTLHVIWSDRVYNYTLMEIIWSGVCYMNSRISSFISKQMRGAQLYLPNMRGKIISTENCPHYLVSANSKEIQINLDDTRILLFTEFSFLLVAWLNMFNCMKCHPWREKLQTNPPSLV